MRNNKIIKRRTIDEIEQYLFIDNIVVLHGARQVGKTSIMRYLMMFLENKKEIVYYIDLEDSRFRARLDEGVDALVGLLKEEGVINNEKTDKKTFVFIDEIQYLKNPSSFLKLIADHHRYLKLIVSGSSSFDIKSKFKNSLVGRTVNFEIFPLSFWEFLTFKNYHAVPGKIFTSIKINELIGLFNEYVVFGGYPAVVLEPSIKIKEKLLQQIIDTYIKKDISELGKVKEIDKFNKLTEVLAAQSGQLLNLTELANTCNITKQTIEKYLFILENTYIIKLVRPYSRNIRSELYKTAKIYFYDTGLAQMLWLKSLPKEIIGHIFETGIFGELAKKFGPNNIYYWRTMDKKEIDFILRIKNDLLPIEAKVNFSQFNKTAVNYFVGHYKIKDYKIVGLKGVLKDGHYIYPWDL